MKPEKGKRICSSRWWVQRRPFVSWRVSHTFRGQISSSAMKHRFMFGLNNVSRRGRVDSEGSPVSDQVICSQSHTLLQILVKNTWIIKVQCDNYSDNQCGQIRPFATSLLLLNFLSSLRVSWEGERQEGGRGKGGGDLAVSWNRISSHSTLRLQRLGLYLSPTRDHPTGKQVAYCEARGRVTSEVIQRIKMFMKEGYRVYMTQTDERGLKRVI